MTAATPARRGIGSSLRHALEAQLHVLRDPDIGRLEFAWMAGIAADWSLLVAILVVAYDAGGALAVGLFGVARMLATTFVVTVVSPSPRFGEERVLAAINLARGLAAFGAGAALWLGLPTVVALVAAALVAGVGGLVRPTQSALMPSLARSPEELVASNVASSTAEALGTFIGPILGGFGAVALGAPVTAVLAAVVFVVAAVAVAGIRIEGSAAAIRRVDGATSSSVWTGLRALIDRPGAGLIILAFVIQFMVRAMLTTLVVVAAIELLGLGESGVGLLNGAMGAGGLIGAVLSIALTSRTRLAWAFAIALTGWGLPIAVIGAWPAGIVAVVALLVLGTSNATLDVAGFTIVQRSVPNELRGGAFKVLEAGAGLFGTLGAALGPLLVAWFGIRGALGVAGAILPVVAVLTWPRIRQTDREAIVPEELLRVLRAVPMFALLPLTGIERLAAAVVPRSLATGEVLMREGDPGDRYYVVASGRVEVTRNGERLRTCGVGDGVGEIALVRHTPRTATVTAMEPTVVDAIDSASFLAAVTGNQGSNAAAERVIGERLSARST